MCFAVSQISILNSCGTWSGRLFCQGRASRDGKFCGKWVEKRRGKLGRENENGKNGGTSGHPICSPVSMSGP